MQLFDQLKSHCAEAGFPLFGALDLDTVDLTPYHDRYKTWLAEGHAGEMHYLIRGADRRGNPHLVFPEAQSIVAVGQPYSAAPLGAPDAQSGIRYARYLRGEDYHDRIAASLESALKKTAQVHSNLKWKVCVDTSALMERTWGALVGLGWIGKNMMLIHPQHGSYFLLGFALLAEKVGRGPTPLKDYCGNCTRCLTACPTQAFTAPRDLDSKRCISYWTLEKRGPLDLSDEQRKAIGNWAAGCDICQEACPFNQKPEKSALENPAAEDPSLPWRWEGLLTEEPEQYRERTARSALNRIKATDFQRNLSIIRANGLPARDKE